MEGKEKLRTELREKLIKMNKEINLLDYYDGSLVKDELMELIYKDIKLAINEIYKEAIANGFTYKEIVELIKDQDK